MKYHISTLDKNVFISDEDDGLVATYGSYYDNICVIGERHGQSVFTMVEIVGELTIKTESCFKQLLAKLRAYGYDVEELLVQEYIYQVQKLKKKNFIVRYINSRKMELDEFLNAVIEKQKELSEEW